MGEVSVALKDRTRPNSWSLGNQAGLAFSFSWDEAILSLCILPLICKRKGEDVWVLPRAGKGERVKDEQHFHLHSLQRNTEREHCFLDVLGGKKTFITYHGNVASLREAKGSKAVHDWGLNPSYPIIYTKNQDKERHLAIGGDPHLSVCYTAPAAALCVSGCSASLTKKALCTPTLSEITRMSPLKLRVSYPPTTKTSVSLL